MADRHLVVNRLKLSYEGLFNPAELYNVISSFFFERTWDYWEKMNEEQVTASGKQIRIILQPWKSVSEYYKIMIYIKMNMIDVKEVEVEHEGEKLKLSQGLVRIIFDAYVLSDRNDIWHKKPVYWFMSYLLERYFFRNHMEKFEDWVRSDLELLHNKIKSYLNMFKYTYQRG